MSKSEVRKLKRVVLFVEYDVLYDMDINEDANPIEDSEVARSLKRVYFIDDDNKEVNIIKKLTDEHQETILYLKDQRTNY